MGIVIQIIVSYVNSSKIILKFAFTSRKEDSADNVSAHESM